MNLRDRLRRACPAASAPAAGVTSPSAPSAAPLFAPPPPPPPDAGFLRVRTLYPHDHVHGHVRVAEIGALTVETLAALGDGTPRPDACGGPLYFDIETTALGGGAGVYPFIVGFAWMEPAGLAVEQFYLADPAAEPAMLRAAAERIRGSRLLVSFSGRGFDERRLEDRYRFLRLESPFAPRAHADLAPLSRALWRSRLGSCTLSAIERARLGVVRTHDLPGAECPAAYFRALRGDVSARDAVLRHNLTDLVSLAALGVALARRRAGACDPAERLGLARHERRRGRLDSALAALEAAAREAAALAPPEVRDLRMELWMALRRSGREAEGAQHLRALCDGPGDPPLDALIDLAKHAEHRARDLALAERCTVHALSLIHRRAVPLDGARRARLEADLARRLSRIERKMVWIFRDDDRR